jgi:hypothetical protein
VKNAPAGLEPLVPRGVGIGACGAPLEMKMLNAWLSIAFQATRLGWQTQTAVVDHLMRMASAGASDRQHARSMDTNKIDPPTDQVAAEAHTLAEAQTRAPITGSKTREVAQKVSKIPCLSG